DAAAARLPPARHPRHRPACHRAQEPLPRRRRGDPRLRLRRGRGRPGRDRRPARPRRGDPLMREPSWSIPSVALHVGDCLDVLKEMPDASVDAIVTDPLYEISFMSRAWDASGVAFNPLVWCDCLRMLKPNKHLLTFGA